MDLTPLFYVPRVPPLPSSPVHPPQITSAVALPVASFGANNHLVWDAITALYDTVPDVDGLPLVFLTECNNRLTAGGFAYAAKQWEQAVARGESRRPKYRFGGLRLYKDKGPPPDPLLAPRQQGLLPPTIGPIKEDFRVGFFTTNQNKAEGAATLKCALEEHRIRFHVNFHSLHCGVGAAESAAILAVIDKLCDQLFSFSKRRGHKGGVWILSGKGPNQNDDFVMALMFLVGLLHTDPAAINWE